MGNREVLTEATEAPKRKAGAPKRKLECGHEDPKAPKRKLECGHEDPKEPKRKLECGHEGPPFGVWMQRLAHLRGVEASEIRLPGGKVRRPKSCEVKEIEVLEDVEFRFRLRHLSTMWSLRSMNSSSEGHPERCPDFLRPVANLEAN